MIVHGPADDAVALDVGKRGHEQTGLGARDTIAQYLKAKRCEGAPRTVAADQLHHRLLSVP